MVKTAKMLVCVMVVAVLSTAVLGQDALTAQKLAQNKVMSLRAARADAMRKLGEKINGLSITSTTKVKDFATESDNVRTAMQAFLLGMRETKKEFSEDGVATITMEVTLDEIIRALRTVKAQYYKGTKFRAEDFSKMTVANKMKVLTVIGSGAPPEEMAEDETIVPDEGGTVNFSKFNQNVKDYWKKYCTARGRLGAERAARVDAMRRLGERIKGVQIDAKTHIKDFMTESDDVNVSMRTFLRGFKEVGVRYHSDDLIVEVDVQIKLSQVIAAVHSWSKVHYKGDKMKLRKLEQHTTRTETRIIKETGMGVPNPKYLAKAPAVVQAVAKVARKAPGWISQTERAVGQGAVDEDNTNKAQAKLMAFRAARLDALRKLGEQLRGLKITSKTAVRDFVALNDEINTSMMTFMAGAKEIEESKKFEDGVATVTVEIELKPLWNSIIFFKKKHNLPLD